MDFTDATFFDGIRQIPPSHFLTLRGGRTEVKRYWEIERPASGDSPGTDEEAAERFRDIFSDAVRLRLRSDVPLGVCLSGGARLLLHRLRGGGGDPSGPAADVLLLLRGPEYDEREFIHPVVEHTGADAQYVFPGWMSSSACCPT